MHCGAPAATPDPVIAVRDCAVGGVVSVDPVARGCPPTRTQLLQGLFAWISAR
jgi:hypothetical protein